MAMKILEDECISCAACESECPRGAISEGDTVYVIDADACTECADEGGPQCVDSCPSDAIVQA